MVLLLNSELNWELFGLAKQKIMALLIYRYRQKSSIVHLYYKVYQALGPTSRDDKVHVFKERDEIHQVLSGSGESH